MHALRGTSGAQSIPKCCTFLNDVTWDQYRFLASILHHTGQGKGVAFAKIVERRHTHLSIEKIHTGLRTNVARTAS